MRILLEQISYSVNILRSSNSSSSARIDFIRFNLNSYLRLNTFLRYSKLCLAKVDFDLETFVEKRFALRLYFGYAYNLSQ